MKTLIAYQTKYGATKRCAEQIAAKLPDGADLLEIKPGTKADLSPYDTVVIGTPVYMGKPCKAVQPFCKRHMDALRKCRVALFLCCMQDQEKAVKDQFALAFPQALRQHAFAMALLGGVVNYAKLRFFDGLIMKLVTSGQPKSPDLNAVTTLSEERIERFAEILQGKP